MELIGWRLALAEIFHQYLGEFVNFKGRGQEIIHTTLLPTLQITFLAADSAAEAVKLSNQARDIENMIIK